MSDDYEEFPCGFGGVVKVEVQTGEPRDIWYIASRFGEETFELEAARSLHEAIHNLYKRIARVQAEIDLAAYSERLVKCARRVKRRGSKNLLRLGL